jgi:hypothetical protein
LGFRADFAPILSSLWGTFIMCSQLALLKNDFELALMYSEIVPRLGVAASTGWVTGWCDMTGMPSHHIMSCYIISGKEMREFCTFGGKTLCGFLGTILERTYEVVALWLRTSWWCCLLNNPGRWSPATVIIHKELGSSYGLWTKMTPFHQGAEFHPICHNLGIKIPNFQTHPNIIPSWFKLVKHIPILSQLPRKKTSPGS